MAITQSDHRQSIHPETALGTVRITVSDLDRARTFYEETLGLQSFELDGSRLGLGVGDRMPLVELCGERSAPKLDRRATGLYHLAILVPTRKDLAFVLARVAAARWPLDGASDHLVSEALYLSDPDGNGIEVYRDRPREQWPRTGERLEMATLPLDLDNLVGELADASAVQRLAPMATSIGHVHLQVSDLGEAEEFYGGVLGFDVMVRGYPGALFVSAGSYHHHVGLNTWHSAGATSPPPGSIGLHSFELRLPNLQERDQVLKRIRAAGIEVRPDEVGPLVRDPSGNAVILRSA